MPNEKLKKISPEGDFLGKRISNNAQIFISGGVVLFLSIWITLDITKRFFTGSPLPVTYNLSELIMGWIIFIPMAYTLFVGQHVQVTILPDRLRPRLRLADDILVYLAALVYFGILTYYSWPFFWSSFIVREDIAPGIHLPWYTGKITPFIGMLLISALCIVYIVDRIVKISGRKA